jgi:glutathione S-transferase
MTPAVGFSIALALLEYLWIMLKTGRARVRYKIEAPAISGDANFERIFRVQQNTLEQLIVFIPGMLVFGRYVNGSWLALLLGLVFVAGRALYLRAYVREPASRGPGFLLGYSANAILVLGALLGSAVAFFR